MALLSPEWIANSHLRTVSGVVLADCPEDGGKWAIYCEHRNAAGEVIGTGVLQDTNKRRLSEWVLYPADWCCCCQEENDEWIERRDTMLQSLDDAIIARLGSQWTLETHKQLKAALIAVLEVKP